MARKAESNGVKETLLRLFGHDDDRSLLAKFAGRDPLKKHRLDPGKSVNVFRRSIEGDNLIKNLLALDAVFDSQDLVCEVAEGKVSPARLHHEIERARARLEKKLHAYGYWVDRLNALESLLCEQPSLEAFALEDSLSADGQLGNAGKGSPYALRAVRLLEKVEEQGRRSLLGAEQLNDKAWALYRLGLSEQAVVAARQAVDADPRHAEAWMLLAVHCINQKRTAGREVAHYQFQREDAEPLSGHERWAEEMRDMAEDRLAKALTDHRSVVFPALRYWPQDKENPHRRYRYRENYEQVRNWCIDWLYSLLQPNIACCAADVDWGRAYEVNGLAAEFAWQQKLSGFTRWRGCGEAAHGLSELETQVAEQICSEWAALVERRQDSSFFQLSFFEPPRSFLRLKLLHIHFVLGLPGYEVIRQRFVDDLWSLRWDDLSVIMHSSSLFQSLITHCSRVGLEELQVHFRRLEEQVAQEQKKNFSLMKANLLCRIYHHAFVRDEFSTCLSVAREAQSFLESTPGVAPPELAMSDEWQRNTLSLKHWKYLELRAAIEIATDSQEAQHALLSVQEPAQYFAEEADYLIFEEGDIDDIDGGGYVAPYGESIISNGQWLGVLRSLVTRGHYVEPEMDICARTLISKLEPMVLEMSTQWQASGLCRQLPPLESESAHPE